MFFILSIVQIVNKDFPKERRSYLFQFEKPISSSFYGKEN